MDVVPIGTEVWIVKTCSVVWMSEDGISVTTLSLCCATAAPANRSRVEPTVVERMVRSSQIVDEGLQDASTMLICR